jgi:hypothetical protein
LKNKGLEGRSTLSACGRLVLARRRWQGLAGGGVAPVDKLVDAVEATVSLGARELCCRMNAGSRSFARAALDLKHAAQVTISAEKLRQVVEEEGRRVQEACESGELQPGWKAGDCQASTPQGKPVSRVYLGVDGFMAPVLTDREKQARRKAVVSGRRKRGGEKPKLPRLAARKKGADQRYKEFKLVQFHDESMGRRLISVTRKDCREAGRVMRRDAGRIDFHAADERVGNVDAAAWILNQITVRCVLLTALVLDFYHLSEHVNAGRRATFGEGSDEGGRWAGEALHAAKHDGCGPFWEKLLAWRTAQRGKVKRKEADGLLHYVSEHRSMICYDQCLARGWRLSSSTTESQCGALPQRVKGPGKRWDADNAEAVMALEALDQSSRWDAYWTTRAAIMN